MWDSDDNIVRHPEKLNPKTMTKHCDTPPIVRVLLSGVAKVKDDKGNYVVVKLP